MKNFRNEESAEAQLLGVYEVHGQGRRSPKGRYILSHVLEHSCCPAAVK